MRFGTLLCLIGLTGGFRSLSAQRGLAIGQRVRLTSARHGFKRVTGLVLAATSDSLRVGVDRGGARETLVLALGDLDKLELRYTSGNHSRRGAWLGLAAGAVAGYVIGAAQYHKCVPQGWFDCLWQPDSPAQTGIIGALAGGLIGAGVGSLIGSLTPAERWREATIRPTTVSLQPLSSGVGVGLAIHF